MKDSVFIYKIPETLIKKIEDVRFYFPKESNTIFAIVRRRSRKIHYYFIRFIDKIDFSKTFISSCGENTKPLLSNYICEINEEDFKQRSLSEEDELWAYKNIGLLSYCTISYDIDKALRKKLFNLEK